MTNNYYIDERHSGGQLKLLAIKDVLMIEHMQFIEFIPVSDESANEYFPVNCVVEALANFLYKGSNKKKIADTPEKAKVRQILSNIESSMKKIEGRLPEYLVFVMEI